jgi:hypothetical protein
MQGQALNVFQNLAANDLAFGCLTETWQGKFHAALGRTKPEAGTQQIGRGERYNHAALGKPLGIGGVWGGVCLAFSCSDT